MIEKATRLELKDCYEIRDRLKEELLKHKKEFLESGLALDFEQEWAERYLS